LGLGQAGNVKGGSIVLNLVSKKTFKSALLAGTAASAALIAMTGVAAAQEAAPSVEKVTVTGTRIKQRDFKSISPIATVGAKEISLTGTVNTEELINTLPQVIPGVTITSNNPSLNGFATADLRGLGAGRTLVLINGRRANPSSASGLVDLNTIPASLIDRIEVISGGASAVYGADAVAGAINFILKDDYEGMTLGGSYSQAEDGAAPQWVADALIGGSFDGDRGSVQLGLQYYNRSAVGADERIQSRRAAAVLRDVTTGAIFTSSNPADLANPNFAPFFSGGSGTAPWGTIGGFSAANVTTVFGPQPDADCRPSNGLQTTGTIRFRNGGGIAPFQNCAIPDNVGAPDANGDRYDFSPDNMLILGNERINASTFAKYDILPNGEMEAFVDAMFTNSRSTQQLAATPATGLTVKYDLDPAVGNVVVNPYVTAQPQLLSLAQLQFGGTPGLDNRTFGLSIRTTQVGNRTGEIETNAFGSTQGLRGTMPSIDWDWEIYHSYARNSSVIKNNNSISLSGMTQLLNACNTTSLAVQAAPLGAKPGCVFPYNSAAGSSFVPTANSNNPLGSFALSDAMAAFVRVNSTDVITYERTLVSGSATGEVVDLWGEGAISAAVGFEYRGEELESRVDAAKVAGDIIGFNQQKSIAGAFDVYDLYGEVQVPLITGETLFENLSLTGGYRKSDYSTGAGITETWKYGGEWSPFAWLTFRAVENHAVRAPSAFELFRAGDQNFPNYTDPCAAPGFGAQRPGDPPGTGVAACTAWFGAFGSAFGGAIAQPNTQVQAFLFGNDDLQPEIADTLTYGVVFNPEWWPVGRLGVSVDRYEIEIDSQIGQRSISQILNGCVAEIVANGNVFPVGPGVEFCDKVTRDPAAVVPGSVGSINQSLANFQGVSTYSGVDVNLRWSWDMEEDIGIPGTFGVSSLYTWTDESDGSVGLYTGSIGGVIPEHKAATSFTYDVADLSLLLRWTYIDGAEDGAAFGTANTAACEAGPSPACAASFIPNPPFANIPGFYNAPLEAYNLFDVGGSYQLTSDVSLSFGVDNLLDEQTPIFPAGVGAGQFNTDGSTYDQLGRQYRFGLRWKH
jgi:iron complex outermembrane recepter protein